MSQYVTKLYTCFDGHVIVDVELYISNYATKPDVKKQHVFIHNGLQQNEELLKVDKHNVEKLIKFLLDFTFDFTFGYKKVIYI